LADKLDTIVGLFLAGERPTGSRDPYGLRRAAHGLLRILLDAEPLAGARVRMPLEKLVAQAVAGYGMADAANRAELDEHLGAFLVERLHYVFEARGAEKRSIRAVVSSPAVALNIPVSDLQENLRALPEFARSEQFRQLATAFKRVRNIVRDAKDAATGADDKWRSALKEPAERALLDEISRRQPAIAKAVGTGSGFREAYAEAAAFEPAVGKFFNEVFVMADDPALRRARLRLMRELEHLILQLGDISEVVASES
jgi:glycyl-tRNA synthetase beta chain